MRIRKMDATFGKLRRSSLELGDGLNIIYGDNETGKSTWCGFIRAMLYGINTREQSKIGFIADKEKYRPYSGESMHGRMEVEWQNKQLTIERTAGRSGIFGAPVVTDAETGKVYKDLGRANSYLARTRWNVNAQPNYVLLSPDGEVLVPVRGYDLDTDGFVKFLQSGLDAYNHR